MKEKRKEKEKWKVNCLNKRKVGENE